MWFKTQRPLPLANDSALRRGSPLAVACSASLDGAITLLNRRHENGGVRHREDIAGSVAVGPLAHGGFDRVSDFIRKGVQLCPVSECRQEGID